MNTCDYLLGGKPDSTALVEATGRRTTYAELTAAKSRVRDLLVGLTPGSRVAIIAPNSLFWVASYLAILEANLVAVPLPRTLAPADIRDRLLLVGAKAVLADRATIRTMAGGIPAGVAIFSDELFEGSQALPPVSSGSAMSARTSLTDPDADAVLMFTSGTTGRPRAVRITHRNIQANSEAILGYLNLTDRDRMLVILPFTYCFGASLLHTHLHAGASLVLQNSFVFAEAAVTRMAEEQCTGLAGVPSSFHLLLRNSSFSHRALPALQHIQQAGGRLPPALIEELVAAQPQARVLIMYGQTEATARLSYLPHDLLRIKAGSVGKGIPGVSLRVVGLDGAPVVPGETGEILARGPSISPGYFQEEDASREKFRDGELHTGDLATVDADGYIYIVDRREDFIKPWGYRVSSLEVEAVVMELTDIVSAAVIGVPDAEAGERMVLLVTGRPGAKVSADSAIDFCRSRLPKYMVPREVHVVDSLPVNDSGKVDKSILRARYSDY